MMIVYGARPKDASLVPGDAVPDSLSRALSGLVRMSVSSGGEKRYSTRAARVHESMEWLSDFLEGDATPERWACTVRRTVCRV